MKMSCPQSMKFLKLKRRLRLAHWQTVGLLESVWLFTQLNAPQGDIGKYSDEDIAAAIEWSGEAGTLVKELIECGFFDPCEVNRVVVHDWSVHAPTYLKGALSKHGRQFAKQVTKQDAIGDCLAGCPSILHPNQAFPNQVLPSLTKPSSDSSESGEAARSEPDVSTVLIFPTVGKGPKEWNLTDRQISEWAETFPGVDVKAECRRALQWVRDNPTKRKTARGMARFLNGWLERSQNRGPSRNGPPSSNGTTINPSKFEANVDEAFRRDAERRQREEELRRG